MFSKKDYQPNRGVSILNDRELAFDNQGTIKSVGTNYSTAQTLDDVIPTLKIMMLGDGSVGKSSLILQYMYKEVNKKKEGSIDEN